MKIMISAGEVSGDVHGACLVREIKKLRPETEFFGVGSEQLAAAGVDIRFDITRRGSIGLLEAVPNLIPLFFVFAKLKRLVVKERPDLVILVDSQGLNLPLARFCQRRGLKTAYYVAPQQWLWGSPKGVAEVAASVGLIIAIFRREYEAYRRAGARVVYFGHPLIDIVKPSLSRAEARNKFLGGTAGHSPVIALCPGSRTQEIKGLLPVLLRAGKLIQEKLPDARFLIPAATFDTIKDGFGLVEDFHPQAVVGQTYDILNASDLALCVSGTINLEASLLGVPNLMVYKLSRLTYLIGKYILKIDKKLKYFSMPNILLDEKIIPELVMADAKPQAVAASALEILRDPARQARMKRAFARLKAELGAPGAVRRAADAIVNFAAA